jgi:uncharacterized protein (TIGR02611 family)
VSTVSDNATDLANGEESPQTGRERGRLHRKLHSHPVLALTTKIVVTLVGGLVLLAGVVMIFTPGQGILAIVLGLAILATEYAWAERWLRKARDKAAEARRRAEAMDPRVRRRRLLLAGLALLVVVGAAVAYLATYDWPTFAVDGWDWVQSLAGWVPDLPGM